MTDAEEKELRAWSAEIAGAEDSAWQPALVSAAFSSRRLFPALTMQGWIDLDAVRSPFLSGAWPEDADGIQDALEEAAVAFGLEPVTIHQSPATAASLTLDVRQAVGEAFSTALKMVRPGVPVPAPGDHGFGSFAPVLAALVGQLKMPVADALALPVMQAFVLLAADKFNLGYEPSGANYRQREAGGDADKTEEQA